jgi:hypothetical protein
MRFFTPIPLFRQPNRSEVSRYIGIEPDQYWIAHQPANTPDEWNKDHCKFILNYWLPKLYYNPLGNTKQELKDWRIAVEAYLSGAELRSDGSTAVSDPMLPGCKDPAGVVHDYVFELRHLGRPDAFGHVWGLLEANCLYRRIWLMCGMEREGNFRWIGLFFVSWIPWNLGKEQGHYVFGRRAEVPASR